MPENQDFQLISPIFPSGVVYLLNILLELMIRVYRGNKLDFWAVRPSSKRAKEIINPLEAEVLRQWLPILSSKTEFDFKDNVSVCWTHEWPSEKTILNHRILLLLRDGRDAVYSHYKRNNIPIQFCEYLRRPCDDIGHLRFNPRLPPAETWALFCLLWKRLAEEKGYILTRFEDLKRSYNIALPPILTFLGTQRDSESIAEAVKASSIERAQEAERKYLRETQQNPQFTLINRRGMIEEWREVYRPEMLDFFEGLPAHALREFGYAWLANWYERKAVFPLEISPVPSLMDFVEKDHTLSFTTVEKILLSRLDEIGKNIPQLISLGKAVMSCNWTRDLFGDNYVGSHIALKTFRILLDLSKHMLDRPLILTSIARSLCRVGCVSAARVLLNHLSSTPHLGFYEIVETGNCYLSIRDTQFASEMFIKAAPLAPVESELERIAEDLIKRGYLGLARRFLVAGGSNSWPTLIRKCASRANVAPFFFILGMALPYYVRKFVGRVRRYIWSIFQTRQH